MHRTLIAAIALPLLALAMPSAAAAQSAARWDVDLGIAAGAETLPAALRTQARHPAEPALGGSAGLRLTVGRIGPFSLEGRGSIHTGDVHRYAVNPNEPLTTDPLLMIREEPRVSPGPQAAWDLRLRFDPAADGAGTGWTLGGGLMTGGVRYMAGSTGHRWADGRLGIEFDVAAYQVPWRTRTLRIIEAPDTPEQFIFEPGPTAYSSRWDLGVGVRLVYTFDLWS